MVSAISNAATLPIPGSGCFVSSLPCRRQSVSVLWDGITAPSFSDRFNGSFHGSFVSLLQSITSKAQQDAHCFDLLKVRESKVGGRVGRFGVVVVSNVISHLLRCHISPPAADLWSAETRVAPCLLFITIPQSIIRR